MTNVELMIKDYEMAESMLKERQAQDVEDAVLEQIEQIKTKLQDCIGLVFETCGTWLWVSGNTKANKEQLKKFGFHYASKKKMWYWKSNLIPARRSRGVTMDYIRDKYGSEKAYSFDESDSIPLF